MFATVVVAPLLGWYLQRQVAPLWQPMARRAGRSPMLVRRVAKRAHIASVRFGYAALAAGAIIRLAVP
ncbi:MAG: hypothetical protein IT195_03505 [Microthrixaceae bacterium]|nr:hypothetical protein [Microthrixaceae bacterium]